MVVGIFFVIFLVWDGLDSIIYGFCGNFFL